MVGQRKAYNTPDSPLVDITREAVPEQFIARTSLSIDVKEGDNPKDFDLKSK